MCIQRDVTGDYSHVIFDHSLDGACRPDDIDCTTDGVVHVKIWFPGYFAGTVDQVHEETLLQGVNLNGRRVTYIDIGTVTNNSAGRIFSLEIVESDSDSQGLCFRRRFCLC